MYLLCLASGGVIGAWVGHGDGLALGFKRGREYERRKAKEKADASS